MTTDALLVGAKKRGLFLSDFEIMTVGMIMDYIFEYDDFGKEKEEDYRLANQSDFNRF